MKLSDTQLIFLSKAAQRRDRAIELPRNIDAVAAEKLVSKLAGAGLIEEIQSSGSLPVWRRLDDAAFTLRITDAGLKTIGVEEAAGSSSTRTKGSTPSASAKDNGANTKHGGKTRAVSALPKKPKKPSPKTRKAVAAKSGRIPASRRGTKLDQVKDLLVRKRGATIEEMMAVTGWLPHTTRAVLTGFRKRGFAIERETIMGKPTAYHITGGPDGIRRRATKRRKGA
jgi:hypothetical protein